MDRINGTTSEPESSKFWGSQLTYDRTQDARSIAELIGKAAVSATGPQPTIVISTGWT
jgi:hypothetical protein